MKNIQQRIGQYFDPFGIFQSSLEVQRAWLAQPEQFLARMQELSKNLWSLQLYCWDRFSGAKTQDYFPAVDYDQRFEDPLWTENFPADLQKQYYLMYTRWLEDAIYDTPDLDDSTKEHAAFWARQCLNAIAPSNFFWTNPVAIRKFWQSEGQSLLKALEHLQKDWHAQSLRMVDMDAFEVGKDLALTPGQVVYRTDLFELIQYQPSTEKVRSTPLLIVPPWINKYYIMDLNPKKSLVRHMVAQGYTVFMISWKNPDASMAETSLEDYMFSGVLAASRAVREISQSEEVHAVGYCIGGIILSTLMAWLNHPEQKEPVPITSWTLLTTLVDFSHPGDIQVFISENSIEYIEQQMRAVGYMDGKKMADTFRLLRSNSLIWHYYIHNYLYGEELPKFDVLFWNMDNTRLPAAMHSFYLREFYLNNKLCQPDALTLGGRSIDLSRINQPLYDVGTEQDHIAPWKETFKIAAKVQGPVRYVLATSGHIVGIISPPVNPPKRRYWVGDAQGHTDAERWRNAQDKVSGSWWDDWDSWLGQHCGEWRAAPEQLGSEQYPPLQAAPGSYVLES